MLKEKINGELVLTINIKAGEIYPIEYKSVAAVNVINYTDGSVFVSEKNNFEFNNNVGKFLTITDGNCYNEYMFYKAGKNTLYIKADADGYICIARKIW